MKRENDKMMKLKNNSNNSENIKALVLKRWQSSISAIGLICLALYGCAGPQYAPVNSRNSNKPSNFPPYTGAGQIPQVPPYSNPNITTNPVGSNNVYTQPISNQPVPSGYYRVMPGDTIYKIGRENNVSPKDLIEWNGMQDPNNIQPFQLIRINANTGMVQTKPVNNVSNTSASQPAPVVVKKPLNYENNKPEPKPVNVMNFAYPVKVINIIRKFDGKGVDFSGKLGDSVTAVGDGAVIYANQMRGYGNLVIVNHGSDVVSAYAHLQQLYVKEQQKVRKGQIIASLGNSSSDQPKLHFELRKKSEPIDPIPYLR